MRAHHWAAAAVILAMTFFLYCLVVYALSWVVA